MIRILWHFRLNSVVQTILDASQFFSNCLVLEIFDMIKPNSHCKILATNLSSNFGTKFLALTSIVQPKSCRTVGVTCHTIKDHKGMPTAW